MKRIIKPAIVAFTVALIAVLAYFVGGHYFNQYNEFESKLKRPEVQWALEHPEQVLKAKDSYEAVHRAADEVYFGILEQGKK